MNDTLLAIWYFLPAGVANMVPILAAQVPYFKKWNTPLDLGHEYKGIRIFGDHKTMRGIITGVIAGVIVGFIQMLSAGSISDFVVLPTGLYESYTPVILGGLLAFGALAGDAIKSFFKRRYGLASGKTWFPFDQTDYIVGACLLGSLVYVLNPSTYVAIIVVWFGAHLLFSYIGYKVGLKSQPI